MIWDLKIMFWCCDLLTANPRRSWDYQLNEDVLVVRALWLYGSVLPLGWQRGHVYVANQFPAVEWMPIVSQKLRNSRQITLNKRRICMLWLKISKFQGTTCKLFFNYSAPSCASKDLEWTWSGQELPSQLRLRSKRRSYWFRYCFIDQWSGVYHCSDQSSWCFPCNSDSKSVSYTLRWYDTNMTVCLQNIGVHILIIRIHQTNIEVAMLHIKTQTVTTLLHHINIKVQLQNIKVATTKTLIYHATIKVDIV